MILFPNCSHQAARAKESQNHLICYLERLARDFLLSKSVYILKYTDTCSTGVNGNSHLTLSCAEYLLLVALAA